MQAYKLKGKLVLTANFRDFEDVIQYTTTVINQLDTIVTAIRKTL